VPQGWDETSSLSRRDYRKFRPHHAVPFGLQPAANGSAIGNWQAVETEFDNSHEAYKRIALHSVDLPKWRPRLRGLGIQLVETGVTRHVIDRGSSSTRTWASRSTCPPQRLSSRK